MSYDNLNIVSQNVLKFYQQLTGDERRIPFIFDDFHFCHSRVIGLDVTENRIFTLCRMITWVLFLRMFWNFISSLPVKRGGLLSFLVRTISNVLVMEIGWTYVGSGGYILVSSAHSNTSFQYFKKFSFFKTVFNNLLWNESLSSNSEQFHQCQQNKQPRLTSNHWMHKRPWHVLMEFQVLASDKH